VRDARAHGVEVRPVDVQVSQWDSTLEPGADACDGAGRNGAALHAVRLGLSRVGGLSEEAGARIVAARDGAAHDGAARSGSGSTRSVFTTAEDLARRAGLDAHDLQSLAAADALRALAGHRHQAAWAVAGIDTRAPALLRETRVHEAGAVLLPPSEADDMLADYRALGLTLNRHPLALLRDQLAQFKVQPAAVLRGYPNGRIARASGLVTHRQRPETAKGTVFVTLEDDTGTVNVIVWPAVAAAQRQPLLAARLLTVFGQWQRGDGGKGGEGGESAHAVMHLVAMKLVDHSDLLQGLVSRSRDFR
jgi:error-prone DNA polymerase